MSHRLATIATLSTLAWLLAAAPAQSAEQQYDCNQVLHATTPNVALLSGLLGIIIPSGSGYVGLSCRPIGPSAPANSKPYCGGTSFGGLLVTGGRQGRCTGSGAAVVGRTGKATAKRRASRV